MNRLLPALGGTLLLLTMLPAPGAAAAGPLVSQQALDNCRQTARSSASLTLDCAPGYATEHDRVTMLSKAPLDPALPWPEVIDYTNSTWLFDPSASGNPSVVVDFSRQGKAAVAKIYDSSLAAQPSYRLLPSLPTVLNGVHPVVQVTAPDGWWIRDGLINFNLDLLIDGQIMSELGAERFMFNQTTNGDPKFHIQVRDDGHDGRPNYEIIQATPQGFQPNDGINRTEIMANVGGNEPALSGYWFWPFLEFTVPPFVKPVADVSRTEGVVERAREWPCTVIKDYGKSPPPIWINAAIGQVQCVREFVASRASGNNWYAYSINRLDGSGQQTADWESPFAFYDLAQAHDGWPDLQVRVDNWNQGDVYAGCGGCLASGPAQLVRYSWDQRHAHSWSYKLDLVGRHPMDGLVRLGDLLFHTIPYEQLPSWVAHNSWDVTVFVANELPSFWSSEGIYAWDARDDVWTKYVTGLSSQAPTSDYQTIDSGFRGEYNLLPDKNPRLYFSPIDHKLHLLDAQGGVWNDDYSIETRYDTMGTPHVVGWHTQPLPAEQLRGLPASIVPPKILRPNEQHMALYFYARQLVFDVEAGVQLRPADVPNEVFATSAPTNHEEWTRLGDLLAANKGSFSGWDLHAMFDQFTSPIETLPGSHVSEYRPNGDGFRFTLDWKPFAGGPIWLAGKPAGKYAVTFDPSHGYRAEALSGPRLEVSRIGLSQSQPAALTQVQLSVAITNRGNQDALNQPVTFSAGLNGGAMAPIGTAQVKVLTGGTAQARVDWSPPRAGNWRIQASPGKFGAASAVDLTVRPALTTGLGDMFRAQGAQGPLGIVLTLLLAASTGLASLLAFGALGRGRARWR